MSARQGQLDAMVAIAPSGQSKRWSSIELRRLCRSPGGRQPKSHGDHLRRRCLHIMAGERIVRRLVACKGDFQVDRGFGRRGGDAHRRQEDEPCFSRDRRALCRQARGRNRCDRGQACFQKPHVIALKLTERNAHIARNRGDANLRQRSGECHINRDCSRVLLHEFDPARRMPAGPGRLPLKRRLSRRRQAMCWQGRRVPRWPGDRGIRRSIPTAKAAPSPALRMLRIRPPRTRAEAQSPRDGAEAMAAPLGLSPARAAEARRPAGSTTVATRDRGKPSQR